jgi:3-deoxy-D-manno-octulosonate 8-phosphate phosphatase (KDO 8-P phosphatase)
MGLFKEKLRIIEAFVFDVDGVLAENIIHLHPSGDLMRTMNTRDGYAMVRALDSGFPIAIISGARSTSIISRFESLGITDIYLNSSNKIEHLEDFIARHNLKRENILYMGDDIPDIEPMKAVGLPTCPNDAAEEVQGISEYISNFPGGRGCVRDIIEQVLRAQGKWLNKE